VTCYCCKNLVYEAGDTLGTQRERPLLKAATKQRLIKIVTDLKVLVCPVVKCIEQ
jgi:hypothetical protein